MPERGRRVAMKRLVGPILILVCTVIWGAAFLGQKLAAAHYGPFAITCYRNVLGAVFLALVLVVRNRTTRAVRPTRADLVGGLASGAALFVAMLSQQLGLDHTTPGISAFLTANYVLLVPVIAWAIGRGRPGLGIWLSVALALAGTFLICLASATDLRGGIGRGEAWTLLCAALFAVQIMVVDRFARGVDVVRFSMVQLATAAALAFPFVFLPSELARASAADFVAGLLPLLFIGVMSSGIAYTLQNLGQARTQPAIAAVIMSMESVFGAFFGWLFLGDAMSARQLAGCGCVLVAVLLSSLLPMHLPQSKARMPEM